MTGSRPRRERRKRGVNADTRVGIMEWRIVAGAIEAGMIQEGRVLSKGMRERGGCVDGVRRSTVRARSMGARRIPEIADAAREDARDSRGDGEASMSSLVSEDGVGSVDVVSAGSGRLRTAQKSERRKEDIVLSSIL